MVYRFDARAEELGNLRLALATFALQLDAFEMRMSGARLGAGMKPDPVPPPSIAGLGSKMIGRQ